MSTRKPKPWAMLHRQAQDALLSPPAVSKGAVSKGAVSQGAVSQGTVSQGAAVGQRLTQLSHGSGCGCKLSPTELDAVLAQAFPKGATREASPGLLIGNETKDDAAVFDTSVIDQGGDELLIATTDFFTPVVDDARDFGRIAAANALSDVYAMGGRPILALAILGWPVEQLDPALAAPILAGAGEVCRELGVPLAGGHSIDAREPFFGLAVNGLVKRTHLRTNTGAQPGDRVFLTKPLGTGLLSTAEKYGTLRPDDVGLAARIMGRINSVGLALGALPEVHAMTDVTGFGLLGHLIEMAEGSHVSMELDYSALVLPEGLARYVAAGALAKGLKNNWRSYGHKLNPLTEPVRSILCDPQTGGGLLVAVAEGGVSAVRQIFREHGLDEHITPIGRVLPLGERPVRVVGFEHVPEIKLLFGLDAAARNQRAEPGAAQAAPLAHASCTPPQPSAANPRETWTMMRAFFGDLWTHRDGLKRQARWIERFAAQKGYRVNPHWMMNANLRLWLVESEGAFGKRYCPCFEPSDDDDLNRSIVCPCTHIDQDIAEKNTCHCGLFGRGDLTDDEFKQAEARLMREYRVDLRLIGDMVDTTGLPTDPHRGLKVPDAYHLAKRAVLLRGLPVDLFVERDFEARNMLAWARHKGFTASSRPEAEGYRVTIGPTPSTPR